MTREKIVLCGKGQEAEEAAAWAEARARDARRSRRAALAYGERVRHAYEEACQVLVTGASEQPSIQISIDRKDLSTTIELMDAAGRPKRGQLLTGG
ncbi:MAG: hypothetical protein AAFN79_16635 [Pseudomonadota bacterium]